VQIHRAKDKLSSERDVIQLILNEKVDDLAPHLPKHDLDRIAEFSDNIQDDILHFSKHVSRIHTAMREKAVSRKDAKGYMGACTENPALHACLFALWDVPEPWIAQKAIDWAIKFLLHNTQSNDALKNRARHVLRTARWQDELEQAT
jgi:hypothetical protein